MILCAVFFWSLYNRDGVICPCKQCSIVSKYLFFFKTLLYNLYIGVLTCLFCLRQIYACLSSMLSRIIVRIHSALNKNKWVNFERFLNYFIPKLTFICRTAVNFWRNSGSRGHKDHLNSHRLGKKGFRLPLYSWSSFAYLPRS